MPPCHLDSAPEEGMGEALRGRGWGGEGAEGSMGGLEKEPASRVQSQEEGGREMALDWAVGGRWYCSV